MDHSSSTAAVARVTLPTRKPRRRPPVAPSATQARPQWRRSGRPAHRTPGRAAVATTSMRSVERSPAEGATPRRRRRFREGIHVTGALAATPPTARPGAGGQAAPDATRARRRALASGAIPIVSARTATNRTSLQHHLARAATEPSVAVTSETGIASVPSATVPMLAGSPIGSAACPVMVTEPTITPRRRSAIRATSSGEADALPPSPRKELRRTPARRPTARSTALGLPERSWARLPARTWVAGGIAQTPYLPRPELPESLLGRAVTGQRGSPPPHLDRDEPARRRYWNVTSMIAGLFGSTSCCSRSAFMS